MTLRLVPAIKQLLVPGGRRPRVIRTGLFQGIKMELDLKHQTQLLFGLFERELHPWFRRLSIGIQTAIDIGSGEGEYALFF